jgi:hypothetical protein
MSTDPTEPLPTQHSLVDIPTVKHFLILPRSCPRDSPSFKILAKRYISHDFSVSTLLHDSVNLLHLSYIPEYCYLLDTGDPVTSLSDLPTINDEKRRRLTDKDDATFSRTSLSLLDTAIVVGPKPFSTVPTQGKLIFLNRNKHRTLSWEKLYRLLPDYTIPQLLRDAKKMMKWPKQTEPIDIFHTNGETVIELNEVKQWETLVIGSGEPFIPIDQSNRKPAMSVAEFESDPSDVFTHLLAFSDETFIERCRAAEFAVAIEQGDREQLKEDASNAHLVGFSNHLISEGILPKRTCRELIQKSIQFLNGHDLSHIAFVIFGPRLCGKTHFLYHFAFTFELNLLLCGESGSFLPFPVDFEKHKLIVNSAESIYEQFVNIAIDSAKYARFDFLPIARQTKTYLLALPIAIKKIRGAIGRDGLATSQKVYEPSPPPGLESLRDFAKVFFANFLVKPNKVIAAFPEFFAKALGFESVVFFIDHFDLAGPALCGELQEQFRNNRFVVTSKTDGDFYRVFTLDDVVFIDCDQIIEIVKSDVQIIIEELNLSFGADVCGGSPAFLEAFNRIVEKVEKAEGVKKLERIRSTGDISRSILIRREVLQLGKRLQAPGSVFTERILKALANPKQVLTIRNSKSGRKRFIKKTGNQKDDEPPRKKQKQFANESDVDKV